MLISDPPAMVRLLTAVSTAAPHALPLWRAVAAGVIQLAQPARGCSARRFLPALKPPKPAIVLIGDDDHAATGPAGWQCAKRLGRWADAAIVHAAGGEPEHYQTAVQGVLIHKRLALIETSSDHATAWTGLFRPDTAQLLILPRQAPHPLPPGPPPMSAGACVIRDVGGPDET